MVITFMIAIHQQDALLHKSISKDVFLDVALTVYPLISFRIRLPSVALLLFLFFFSEAGIKSAT